MSIAEMIMEGTERQSKNWSVLSDSLGKLGQQIGNQLATREYQKQAAEALPMIQQQMQSALQDAGKGRSAAAYSKLLPLLSNPAYTQNQFILPVLNTGLELTGLAAQDSYKRSLMNMQYGGRFAPSQMPSDEEMLSDDFGVTNTTVEGDGMGGGDIRVSGGQTPAKSIPGMEARLLSPDEQAYAEMMAMQQGEAPAGQPQEIAALRQPGQLDFSLSGYIPPQKDIEKASKSYNEYLSKPEDERKDFISDIPATGKVPEEGDKMEIWGMGTGTVIGPKAAPEPEEMEVTGKEVGITGGKPFKKLKQERKKKTPEEIKAEIAAQEKYDAWRKDYSTAKLMFQRNSQLRSILERAGGDITKLNFDIETVTDDFGKPSQVANIKIGDEVVGQLETTAPEGIMSEFQAYTAITGAPILFGEGSKWKFYKTEGEEKPATPAPAGEPAPSVAAPAEPEIPEEAAGLQQIVAQGQAAKAGEQTKATEKRIKAIDAEIKRLSSPKTEVYGYQPPGGFASTPRSARQKSPEEAQADIQKITKLKAEKDALLGKKPLTQQEIKEGAIVSQGGKKYRFTNGKYIPID